MASEMNATTTSRHRPRRSRIAVASVAVAFAGAIASGIVFAQTPPASTSTPTDPATQPTLQDDKDVIEAGRKWLALVDSGQYDETWEIASPLLKGKVSKEKWNDGLRNLRKPLGKLVSRTPEKFARAHQLPGAPDGDYVIVEYTSTFENGKHPEQLTWSLEKDDIWRVSGYFIR